MQILDGSGSDEFYRKQVFLGTDEVPLTYRAMMDLCEASDAFDGTAMFTGTEPAGGKTAIGLATKERLGWHLKYKSFESFVNEAKGKDFYNP